MSTEKGFSCPRCGDKTQIGTSIVAGHKVCNNCGYCDVAGVFAAVDKTVTEAPNIFILHVKERMCNGVYKQYGISHERAMFLMGKVVEVVQGKMREGMNLLSVGDDMKYVALWCATPEELVSVTIMYMRYMERIGAIATDITAGN